MEFDLLPNELLQTIISYLDIKSAKQMSLTSKKMHSFALSRIWSKPRYPQTKDIDFLEKISKFPISELHTLDFNCTWFELVTLVPGLKLLHVDEPKYLVTNHKVTDPSKSRLSFLKVPTIVHTKAMKFQKQEHFSHLSEIIESINVKELVIDHSEFYEKNIRISFEQFKKFVGKVKIPEISMDCLQMNDENAEEYIKLLATFKNCRLFFTDPNFPDYFFSVKDLELMVKMDLKIIKIESHSLRTEGEVSKLLEFAEVMKKMKYLEEFQFSCEEFDMHSDVYAPMELLTDLPIKSLISWHFKFEKGKFEYIARTISEMKHLTKFYLQQNYTSYVLLPEELALFKKVPITYLDLDVLDLKRENVVEFRDVMKEMKIECIEWDDDKDPEDIPFEIDVKAFGPGGIYKTI